MILFNKFKKRTKGNILQIVEKAHLFRRYILLVIGIVIYAVGYNLFLKKNNIVSGGASGISIITKDFIDPSLMILILNIFLLTLSYFTLGKNKTINSVVGSIMYPLCIKLTAPLCEQISIDNSDLLLIAIIGGVCIGFASGTVFKSGFTTGGTDILNQIVAKYAKVSIGTAMLLTDGFIVLTGGFFFGWTRALYALIVLYIINIMVDKVVLGISGSKAVYITTSKDDEVSDYILYELKLGVTLLETRGGYTNKKDEVILCVVPTNEYYKVKEGIHEIDEKAFFVVCDAYEVFGGE